MSETSLAYTVLGFVAARPDGIHGYRLRHEVAALCEDTCTVNYGRIYRILELLEQSGDVDVRHEVQNGRPNRRVYTITEKGQRTVGEWLGQSSTNGNGRTHDELSMKLPFVDPSALGLLSALVEGQRHAHLGKLARATRRHGILEKAGLDERIARLIIDGVRMRVKAELAWLEHVERTFVKDF